MGEGSSDSDTEVVPTTLEERAVPEKHVSEADKDRE